MTLRTHTINKKNPQHKQVWEWQEHEGVIAAVEQLHKSSQVVEDLGTIKKLHVGNTNPAPLK